MHSTESPNGYPVTDENIEPIAISGLPIAGAGLFMFLPSRRREIKEELEKASLLPYCEDIETVMKKQEYAVVGGLPIDAFNHSRTIASVEQRVIVAPEIFDTPLLREKNKTVRDFDILVFSRNGQLGFRRLSDEAQRIIKTQLVRAARRRAQHANQPAPEMSIVSFDNHSSLVHSATIASENGRLSLEQGYVKQGLPENAMEPWNLILANGTMVQILNPWEQYWRSMIRFSSGMKLKDQEKLDKMLSRLRSTPELAEMEQSELCIAYRTFYDNMVAQNSFSGIVESIRTPDRNWSRVIRVGGLAVASSILKKGQSIEPIEKLVQSTPRIFNHFTGNR